MARILVVVAHPDDEVLGMGGTLSRLSREGHELTVHFLADGVSARGGPEAATLDRRRQAAQAAAAALGGFRLVFDNLPDNCMDTVPLLSIAKAIERVKSEVLPEVVFTHHPGDLNIDHRLVAQAVLTAFRPQPGERCHAIFSFAVPSSTEWSHRDVTAAFQPDTWVDVSAHLDALMAACHCYAEEMRPDPHARSYEAVKIAAQYRGRQVGVLAAESFATLRRIAKAGSVIPL